HVHAPHTHTVQHHHHHAARPVPARKPTTTVVSKKLVEECAKKPRSHLGSQVYKSEPSVPRLEAIDVHARVKHHNSMTPIPYFEGKENCTYTVRVPRDYVAHQSSSDQGSSCLEEICNHRQVWGTDVYTDDSDVVAAAVHSGWLKGDFGEFNDDLRELEAEPREDGEAPAQEGGEAEDATAPPHSLTNRPRKPASPPPGRDAHITLLLLPPLEHYASTTQHHIRSREWAGNHDGMSFMIHRIDFVDEAPGSRFRERGAKTRKARI
ncbi:histone deacetylation protein Rxt3-domain-containing protein, partial [Neohortaea acidophila]